MTSALARDLYRAVGRLDEFLIDVDVLVEMYVVNGSNAKHYLRDFQATVIVDGKEITLVRQSDFHAWEYNNRPHEYCLDFNETGNMFDRSHLEALRPLYDALPVELESRKPLEGWVHFIAKDVDPEKLNNNHSYRFTFKDSLGKEWPISKSSSAKRRGEVSVRPEGWPK